MQENQEMNKQSEQKHEIDTLQSELPTMKSPIKAKPYKIVIGVASFFLIGFIASTIGLAIALKEEVDEKYIELSYSSWKKLTPKTSPPKRLAHASLKINNDEMVIFGGLYGHPGNAQYVAANKKTMTYNDMWIYNAKKNSWRKVSQHGDIPSARFMTTLSRIDNKLYLFGGYNHFTDWGNEHDSLGDFYEFDIKTSTWKTLPTTNGPTKRGAHETISSGNTIFLFGGAANIKNGTKSNAFFEYNTDSQIWTNLTDRVPAGLEGRLGFGMVHVGEEAYIYGGTANDAKGKGYQPTDFWKLSIATRTFSEQTAVGNVPASRQATATATSIYGHVFLFGGLHDQNGVQTVLNDIDMYSEKTQKWYQLYGSWRQNLFPRFGHSVNEIHNRLYVFGGRVGNGAIALTNPGSDSLWQYIPPKYVYKDDDSIEKEIE